MKTRLVILLIFFSVSSLKAQHKLSFMEVDTATYRAYINSDWNRIIHIGNQALHNDIDYYYLRLRIAYAYYMKKEYRKAIPHYQKALEFSSRDATASEFLYYCYKFSGREKDALKISEKFPEALRNYLQLNYSKKISNIAFFATYGSGAASGMSDEIMLTVPDDMDGAQTLPTSYFNLNLGLSHRLNNSTLVNHTINLLYKNEFAYSIYEDEITSSESKQIRQFNYNLSIDITPVVGFEISPLLSYVNYKIPTTVLTSVGFGNLRQTTVYNNYNEYAIGFKASKQLGMFKLSLAGSHSNFNLIGQNTGAASLSFYPFGNLNLYFTSTGYMHVQTQYLFHLNQYIQSHEIGFKVLKNLWIEGNIILGDFTNFYDAFSGLTYNGLEKYKRIVGVNAILPFFESGASIFIAYRNYQSESVFVPQDNSFEEYNNKIFNYYSITGGISWKF